MSQDFQVWKKKKKSPFVLSSKRSAYLYFYKWPSGLKFDDSANFSATLGIEKAC